MSVRWGSLVLRLNWPTRKVGTMARKIYITDPEIWSVLSDQHKAKFLSLQESYFGVHICESCREVNCACERLEPEYV